MPTLDVSKRIALNKLEATNIKVDTAVAPYMGAVFVVAAQNVTADGGVWTFTIPFAVKILDVWAVKTEHNASGTEDALVKNGSNTVATLAFASTSVDDIIRAAALDDTYVEVSAGANLKVTYAKNTGGYSQADVYILCMRTA